MIPVGWNENSEFLTSKPKWGCTVWTEDAAYCIFAGSSGLWAWDFRACEASERDDKTTVHVRVLRFCLKVVLAHMSADWDQEKEEMRWVWQMPCAPSVSCVILPRSQTVPVFNDDKQSQIAWPSSLWCHSSKTCPFLPTDRCRVSRTYNAHRWYRDISGVYI